MTPTKLLIGPMLADCEVFNDPQEQPIDAADEIRPLGKAAQAAPVVRAPADCPASGGAR